VDIVEEIEKPPNKPATTLDERLSRAKAVNRSMRIGNKGRKLPKQPQELDLYFERLTQEIDLKDNFTNWPHDWWRDYGRLHYPILFKMAVDLLSIPPTSCECERSFSAAKRTITDDRNSLIPATIEALQLQKHWVRQGLVWSELTKASKRVRGSQKTGFQAPTEGSGADLFTFG
jgi:hypothetical protein